VYPEFYCRFHAETRRNAEDTKSVLFSALFAPSA
jgi:hypothetical protein